MIGYTRVTLIITNRCYLVIISKSIKIINFGLFYETLKYEDEIISNCILLWYSEF